jgi:hypothetical protein
MISILEFLGCGNIYKSREALNLVVRKLDDIAHRIVPLFKIYPVLGVKAQDFEDFSTVVKMIKAKKHLTEEGLEEIIQIKGGMNKGRIFSEVEGAPEFNRIILSLAAEATQS